MDEVIRLIVQQIDQIRRDLEQLKGVVIESPQQAGDLPFLVAVSSSLNEVSGKVVEISDQWCGEYSPAELEEGDDFVIG